jgi:hypothetical protein
MTAPTGATLADWLAAHDLTPDQCRRALQDPDAVQAGPAADPVWPIEAQAQWRQIAQVLAACLPEGADSIALTLDTTRTDFSSTGRWGGRSFTLHDDGQGRPMVVCHLKARLSDLLTLAHEFGHATQIVACGAQVPPVLRELSACLAEGLVVRHWPWSSPALGQAAERLLAARGGRKSARRLLAALDDPATPYDYAWNYPLARKLAGARMTAQDQWRVFAGQMVLADLMGP